MRRWILLMLGLVALGAEATAQPGIRLRHIGPGDGLPSPRVYSIAQDSLGYLWVGTNDGAARYDGVRFDVWRSGDGGLPSNLVYAVHVDAAGDVWVGTDGGLARLDRARDAFVPVADSALAAVKVTAIRFLSSDVAGLVVSGRPGFFRVSREGEVRRVVVNDFAPDVPIRVGGRIWSRTCRVPIDGSPCKPTPGETAPHPRVSWEAGQRSYVLRTDGLVAEVDAAGTERPVTTWPGAVPVAGSSLVASFERVWIGSESGLRLYRPEEDAVERIGPAQGLLGTDVLAVYEDRQGGVWVGTELGLHRWTPPRSGFRAVTPADGLGDGRVNGLTTVGDDLWVATNGGLFQRRPDGAFRDHLAGGSLYESAFWQVAPAAGGGLWLGGKRSGVQRFWPETGRLERVDDDLSAQVIAPSDPSRLPIRHLSEHDGRLWVGSSLGLAVRESGRWRVFRQGEGGRDGLTDSAVNTVYADRTGRLWVGSDGGLDEMLLARRAFRRTGVQEALGLPVVWHVAETDADPGALWLATVGDGACRYVPATDTVDCVTTEDGLPSNVVHRIEPGDGALWLGTDRGLVRLDPATREVVVFTQADGLHGDIIDLMSSHRAPDGTIVMGGPGGYTAFRPEAVRPSAYRPSVRITAIEANGRLRRSIAEDAALWLGADERRFAVRFASLDFTRPRINRYRYRLAPLEEAWTETDGAAPEARYAALPPGTYTFEVQGSNHAGVFTSAPARLTVTVEAAWWERRGAQGLGVVLALLGVGAVGWAGVRRSERRRAEAAEVARRLAASREAERLRLARELHDGTMQHLYRVGHDLDRLATLVPEPERAEVTAARTTLDEASGELRGVLADIRLPHVGTFGAAAAVRSVVERFEQAAPGVRLRLALEADGRRWPVEVQHAATRIVQEALGNVARHAEATAVTVSLAERGGRATVEVVDDGRGFDMRVSEVAHVRGDHFGLAGLRERAEALGGRAEVTSTPGAGTRVRAWLPLPA